MEVIPNKIFYTFQPPADRLQQIALIGWITHVKGNIFADVYELNLMQSKDKILGIINDMLCCGYDQYVRTLQYQIENNDLSRIDPCEFRTVLPLAHIFETQNLLKIHVLKWFLDGKKSLSETNVVKE